MKKFTFDNPQLLSLKTIEERLRIAFRHLPFQFTNSELPLSDNDDTVISSVGSTIFATVKEDLKEIGEIEQFLNVLLAPNYVRMLTEFANKFKAIEGATVEQNTSSNISININGTPAATFRLWLNSDKQPHEIEIIPSDTAEGIYLAQWVTDNKRDILKADVYSAGDLRRMTALVYI